MDSSAKFAVITKSDATILTKPTKGIYVGGAGNVTIVSLDDPTASAPITFVATPVGTILPVKTKRIMSTGTTATNLVALF